MNKTIKQKQLEEDNKYWKAKADSLETELYALEKKKKENEILSVEREDTRKQFYLEENRKLWYLVRTLIKDENLKPFTIKFQNGEERIIDIFSGDYLKY